MTASASASVAALPTCAACRLPVRALCARLIAAGRGRPKPRLRRVTRDTTVCAAGPAPAFSGVLRCGLLRAERIVRDGSRVILAIEAPGALVGDWAGPAGSPALIAASDAELCLFDPGSVRALLATDPEARRHVLRDIDARCDRQNDMIWRRGALSAAERIASVLVTPGLAVPLQRRPDGSLEVRVVLSRPDWADLAGATVESVCRTMAGLAERGLVERLAPGRYLIRDEAALAALVVVPAGAPAGRIGWPDTDAAV